MVLVSVTEGLVLLLPLLNRLFFNPMAFYNYCPVFIFPIFYSPIPRIWGSSISDLGWGCTSFMSRAQLAGGSSWTHCYCSMSRCQLWAGRPFNSFHLICQLCPFLGQKALQRVVHALVISSWPDYCNRLFVGLPLNTSQKFQFIQNVL